MSNQENYLICLRYWQHDGVVGYEEHTGNLEMVKRLAVGASQRPNVYQARATGYRFGIGSVVNSFETGRFNTGWRF